VPVHAPLGNTFVIVRVIVLVPADDQLTLSLDAVDVAFQFQKWCD